MSCSPSRPSHGTTTSSYTAAALLEALGIEVRWVEESRLEDLLSAFGGQLPSHHRVLCLCASAAPEVDPLADPDGALVEWMTIEEVLFRTLEKHLLTADLERAAGDVEAILVIAQRVFQRRRARAGQALENHVQQHPAGGARSRILVAVSRRAPNGRTSSFPESTSTTTLDSPRASLHHARGQDDLSRSLAAGPHRG